MGCGDDEFSFVDGYYAPVEVAPNAECYDCVWDFGRSITVINQEPMIFSIDVWPDDSGEFPGILGFYPCTLDGMNFDCSGDAATYPDPASCEDRAAEEVDLFTAEGSWTADTAFDVTFTYRRAIVWEDGTDTTCPDVCTSVWDLSETLDTPL